MSHTLGNEPESAAGGPVCRCGHPAKHHEAGECWTTADGFESFDRSDCRCNWYEPAPVAAS